MESKTGYINAFIIDEKVKNKLLEKDLSNEEVIKPILRSRDIGRYHPNFQNLYLINTHNGLKNKRIPRIDAKKNYPSIYEHLLEHKEQLIIRYDKGDHWSNLRDCAYLDNFQNTKIIYSEIVQKPQFYLDKDQFYLQDPAFLITGNDLIYLLGFLNSPITAHFFKNFYSGGSLGFYWI